MYGVLIGVLGHLVVEGPTGEVHLPGSIQRTIVARLAVQPDGVVAHESLIDAIWGQQPPQTAPTTLRSHIARLRTRFREHNLPCAITTRGSGYALEARPDEIDAMRFEKMVSGGRELLRTGDAKRAVIQLRSALQLWRGQPLSDCRKSEWSHNESARLSEVHIGAIECLLRSQLLLAEHDEVIPELEKYVIQFPLREQLWEMLMLALHRSGRRADALAVYLRARTTFAEELGLEPSQTLVKLESAILRDDPSPDLWRPGPYGATSDRPPARRPGNLPAETTSFVGRETEISEVTRLLGRSRMVTLTGVGGVGKSRLAVRTASKIAEDYPGGVWLVDLSELHEPSLIPHLLAETLDIHDRTGDIVMDSVIARLQTSRTLLILDGCEHLRDKCGIVAEALLRASSDLRILATSRQALAVPGEHVMPILPLPLPPPGENLGQNVATTLFVERATAALPLSLQEDGDRQLITEICGRLDGIPLAIELAAVRLRVMSLQELLRRLENQLGLLVPNHRTAPLRQQTIRATIDWSFNLCTPQEQQLWAQLSVFAGTFDLAAAEAVYVSQEAHGDDVLSLIGGLVDKSILSREGQVTGVRFRMLGILREYGKEQLRAQNVEHQIFRNHQQYYLRLIQQIHQEWFGSRQLFWFDRLRSEYPSIRAALELFLTSSEDAEAALELATHLHPLWISSDFVSEGVHWLDTMLKLSTAPTRARANALWVAARVLCLHGDLDKAAIALQECEELAQRLGDEAAYACATHIQGTRALMLGNLTEAERRLKQIGAMQRARQAPAHLSAIADVHLAMAYVLMDEPEKASALCVQSLAHCDRHGELWVKSYGLYVLACAQHGSGHVAQALTYARQALQIKREFRDQTGLAMTFDLLGLIFADHGDSKRASFLLGVAQQCWNTLGKPWFGSSTWRRFRDEAEKTVRKVSSTSFDSAFRAGLGSPLDTAIQIAEEPFDGLGDSSR